MLPHRSSLLLPSGSAPRASDRAAPDRILQCGALTLVEVMFALFIQAAVMLAIIGSFIQSRRITESSVLHAAATSLVYGIIEQVKQIDYDNLPNSEVDPAAPTGTGLAAPPYIRVRINQARVVWLQVVNTPVTDMDSTTTTIPYPKGPTTTPAPLAVVTGSFDNNLGEIPLSTITGTSSQDINLHLMIWIDGISNKGVWAAEGTQPVPDTADVKVITVIYTYAYQDGNVTRTVRDREVFVRTRYDQ